MSLWTEYLAERMGHKAIEREWGFLTYKIAPPFCMLEDVYVRSNVRSKGHVFELLAAVRDEAKAAGCTHYWAQVWVADKTATRALRCDLAWGFQVVSADNGRIIMTKEIGV